MTSGSESMLPRPLEDVTVVDLTSALAGNFATQILGGLGAIVLKIEHPEGGDRVRHNPPFFGPKGASLSKQSDEDISMGFLARCRNKSSITLNLKRPEAIAVFKDLTSHADVVMENFSRGTANRLGIGYETARAANPKIVYCALSGYGQKGEPGTGKAMDGIIQAASGLMMTSGSESEAPVRVGMPVADLTTPLFAVIAIVSAVHQVRRGGQGQFLDVAMFGAVTSLVASEPFALLESLGVPMRSGNTVPRLAPFGIYRASDGWVAISAGGAGMFEQLMEAIGRPELTIDERFATRGARTAHYRELDTEITSWTEQQTMAGIVATLEPRGVAVSPVRTPHEAESDPIALERGDTVLMEHPTLGPVADVYAPGFPVVFTGSHVAYDRPAPTLGEHNEAVYGDLLGYSSGRLKALREAGVI